MVPSSSLRVQWLKAVAPDEPHKLQRRLDWDGLTLDGLQEWLENVSPPQIESTTWMQTLQDCCKLLRKNWDMTLVPDGVYDQQSFVDIWWPIRCHYVESVKQELTALGISDVRPTICDQLADSLLERLCALGEPVLWELFSAGRNPGTMLLAHLGESGNGSGPPTRAYYEAFIHRHRKDGLLTLLEKFPVLGRFIGTVVSLWFKNSLEMLQRIRADRRVLETVFGVAAGSTLCEIRQGISDPHCGGRVVAILSFSDPLLGADKVIRLVYKPKNMGLDAAYQDMLRDLNDNSDLAPLQSLAVYAGDGYGYMEYVPHRLCADQDAMQRFYTNAGRLTAILHVLGCTDCHHENLIACGDQLLLIDSETLLEPDVPDHISNQASNALSLTPSGLQERFQSSVLRTGLLPQWMIFGVSKKAVDISALGIKPPAKLEHLALGWLGINTDGMMPGRVRSYAEMPTSLPVGVGAINPLHQFLDAFCDGFESQSQVLFKLRNHLLAENSSLLSFAGLHRRIILRATRVYSAIQQQQLQPSALRSPIGQALKLEQLARCYLLAESKPLNWQVFSEEVQQMQQLDIPFFTHTIDSRDLCLGGGERALPEFIRTSGLASVKERLLTLNTEEIEFQLQLIKGAVEARHLWSAEHASSKSQPEVLPEMPVAGGDDLSLHAAIRIAEKLLAMAIRDSNGKVEWLGIELGADGDRFSFGPVGLSLYGGQMGIACLLQRLIDQKLMVKEVEGTKAAIIQPLRDLVEYPMSDTLMRWWRDQPLGINGCGGILLGLQELGEQELAATLLSAAVSRSIATDKQLDVIGGCAGLIGPLVRLGSDSAIELAICAGDHLIAKQGDNGGWSTFSSQAPLLGFSHGTAGCAAALAHLHAISNEPRFRISATNALAYERSHFNKDHGNWPDFRSSTTDGDAPRYMVSWCHGAPGIALGRACLWGTALWDEKCTEEIAIALDTTASYRYCAKDHLCCGTLGLMVLLEAIARGPWPIRESLRIRCIKVAGKYRQQALLRCMNDQIELRCIGKWEGSFVLPGAFTGLSGMGLAFLEDESSRNSLMQLISAGLWPL